MTRSSQVPERMPFSGECQAEVKHKDGRNHKGMRGDYTCRRITDIVQNGEWRCGYHTDSDPAFIVKGKLGVST